mgnify:CR=1 FL=1
MAGNRDRLPQNPDGPLAAPQSAGPTPFGELCYVLQDETGERCQPVAFTGEPSATGPFLFSSPLRTIYNDPVYLEPQGDAGSRNCVRPSPTGPMYYAAPSGSFTLVISGETAGQGKTHYLLCGLSGTENIAFQTGDVLTLFPSKPAYAGTFPVFGPTATPPAAGEDLLSDRYTTSWAVVTPGPSSTSGKTTYYAQPQQAPLFLPGATSVTGATGATILDLYPAPAAEFGPTAAAGPTGLSFPLFPYAGVEKVGPTSMTDGIPAFTAEDMELFEQQVLGPTRRAAIAAAGGTGPIGAADDAGATLTTTPQGFLTTVSGLQWQKVVLASSSPTGPENPPPLQFTDLTKDLQNALQTNQLFLVVTKKAPLGAFQEILSIEGWPFIFNVGSPSGTTDFSNVLVFKFRPGALVDLVASPSAWTQAETFNETENVAPVSSWLQAYFSQALSWVNEYPDFQDFVDIITNPGWTGVLALKTTIDLDEFPAQLKGLLGGIDLSEFDAHHVGIEVNFVDVQDGQLVAPQSSLFALINYVSPAYAHEHNLPTSAGATGTTGGTDPTGPTGATGPAASGPYDFSVEVLQVLFENSKIKDFFSRIKLTASSWFDEQATVETDASGASLPSYDIELDGHYEDHHGHPSYTFVTAKGQHYTFGLDSAILNYLEVEKAQFVTERSKTATGPTATTDSIQTAFNFWGYMNFKPLPGFDIFSFGSPTGAVQDGQGLYFSNLSVGMDFEVISGTGPTAGPPTVQDRAFTFEPSGMAFDPSLSTLRPGSLLSGFPMAIQGLIPGVSGASGPGPQPSAMGYRAITLPPEAQVGPLGSQWYALQLHLQMGSMGALAAKAGFVGNVLAAWSPSAPAQAMLGIKLPGGDNSGFSLENVLKLKIGDIAFVQEAAPTGPTGATGATGATGPTGPAGGGRYMLQMKHLGLSLVGVTFPPHGNTDLYLFGPTATAASLHPSDLGWYGAYVGPTAPGGPTG